MCIHTCMHRYTCTCMYMYVHYIQYVHTYMYVYIQHTCVHTYMYVCTEYPTHRQIKLPPGPGSFCSKKPNRVPRRRQRSVSQAAQGLLLRPELAFDTLVTSRRPLVMHALRKIRVRADSERTRRSSSFSCLLSHPISARWCVHEAFL